MTRFSDRKLNKILPLWPRGTAAVCPWLKQHGLYQKLIESYKKSGSLKAIGHGAVSRPDDKVTWEGAIYTIQNQLNKNTHPGGKTALEMQGYGHYVPLGRRTITLYSLPQVRLPAWFLDHDWGVEVRFVAAGLFTENNEKPGFVKREFGDFSIRVSSPERAMLELLHLTPNSESYEESKLLMEGMTTLRPLLVQKLLESCRSIKVKRLFMFLAEITAHPWLKKIDLARVDFGKGKRSLFKGGHLDPKYLITVPEIRRANP